MAEHPILFSGPMVRAILEGRKTVTRRPVTRPKNKLITPEVFDPAMTWASRNGTAGVAHIGPCDGVEWRIKCPFGVNGDRLWVRETWARLTGNGIRTVYRADGEPRGECEPHEFVGDMRWTPSIHMPRWASRLTLKVLDVRVERLHAITEEEAKAEGMDGDCPIGYIPAYNRSPLAYHFAQVWDAQYGKGPYAMETNPWVWRIEFRRVEQ